MTQSIFKITWDYRVFSRLRQILRLSVSGSLRAGALALEQLGEKEDDSAEGRTKKHNVDAESAREESRITCGADIVIGNVLPFLKLEE
eukprot:scaffold1950_cov143-Skeletonema_menzelii.AAC.4